jgi:hypothetical protein
MFISAPGSILIFLQAASSPSTVSQSLFESVLPAVSRMDFDSSSVCLLVSVKKYVPEIGVFQVHQPPNNDMPNQCRTTNMALEKIIPAILFRLKVAWLAFLTVSRLCALSIFRPRDAGQ